MDANELWQLIVNEFGGSEELAASVALCPDQTGDMEFLKAFEAGMQSLIENRQHDGRLSGIPFWIAFNFDPVLAGSRLSYRRALMKYSNSIVFEDLGIGLLLVQQEKGVERIAPEEVNDYLRELNSLIARHKSQTR